MDFNCAQPSKKLRTEWAAAPLSSRYGCLFKRSIHSRRHWAPSLMGVDNEFEDSNEFHVQQEKLHSSRHDILVSNEAEGPFLKELTDVWRRLGVSEHLTPRRWSGAVKEHSAVLISGRVLSCSNIIPYPRNNTRTH